MRHGAAAEALPPPVRVHVAEAELHEEPRLVGHREGDVERHAGGRPPARRSHVIVPAGASTQPAGIAPAVRPDREHVDDDDVQRRGRASVRGRDRVGAGVAGVAGGRAAVLVSVTGQSETLVTITSSCCLPSGRPGTPAGRRWPGSPGSSGPHLRTAEVVGGGGESEVDERTRVVALVSRHRDGDDGLCRPAHHDTDAGDAQATASDRNGGLAPNGFGKIAK